MRTLAVLSLSALFASTASANLPVEFSYPQQTSVTLDVDASVVCTGTHVVREGETLTSIAEALLGPEATWEHLARVNPIGTPNAPKPGTVLIVPRPAVAGKMPPAWALVMWTTGMAFKLDAVPLTPVLPGTELPDSVAGMQVAAIRQDALPGFWKQVAQAEAASTQPAQPMFLVGSAGVAAHEVQRLVDAKTDGYAKLPVALGGRTRPEPSDPVRTIRERWRVTGIEGDAIRAERTGRRLFDESGKELAPKEVERKKASMDLLLLVLGGAALLALLVVAARRLRATRPSAA